MPRFNPFTYSPSQDSAPGSAMTDQELAALQAKHSGVILGVQPGDCPCGCGETPKSDKRTFMPGHDARYRGVLLRAYVTSHQVHIVTDGHVSTCSPLDLADEHGWGPYLEAAWGREEAKREDRIARRHAREIAKADRAAKKQKLGPVQVKIGRWTYVGDIVARDGGQLTVAYTNAKGDRLEKVVSESQVISA